MNTLIQKFSRWAIDWLIRDGKLPETPLCDFNRLKFELRPCDVLLVEGRSRVSEVIKIITQSPWSHSALYLGRLYDIRDAKLRTCIEAHFEGDPEEQLLLEAILGKGTIVTPLSEYKNEHLRICRPEGLAADDAQQVLGFAINKLGSSYDLRQVLDLARFFFPWAILPRRWRSSLFQHNAGNATQTVCSTLLAEAFSNVDFPILPFIDRGDDGSLRLFKRNPKLFAPRDFDYSPYFSIIKYPFLGMNDIGLYRRLPWDRNADYVNEQPPPTKLKPSSGSVSPSETPQRVAYLDRAMNFAGLRRKEL